ncbi:MAG TPA: hypothetical protein VID93_01520 [Acidimicrobiales bacterium]
MICYLIGLIGAGSFAGFEERGRRARGETPERLGALSPGGRLRAWHRRHREIRALNRCYAQVSEREPHGRWRRRALRAVLLIGPAAAVAGVALLSVTAVLAQPSRIALVAAVAAVVVMACTVWCTAAVLAVAANVLGVMALVVNQAAAVPASSRGPLAVTFLALAALVAVSALVMSQREPPHTANGLGAIAEPGAGLPIADATHH